MVRKVTIYTHVAEYSNDFRVDDSVTHCAKKREYENKEKTNGNFLQQRTIASTILNANSKKELIEDLIHAFAVANIPLEKVNSLLPFFQKHIKQEEFIPQAPTLRQIYLPQ
ncbi:8006_t:CDS:2, partial [Funneliformis geosporum]